MLTTDAWLRHGSVAGRLGQLELASRSLLCRMFTFLSQCNKKCTTFSRWGVEVSRRQAAAAPVGNGCCTSPIRLQSDIMAPVRTWATWRSAGGAPLLADHPAMRNLTAVYELIARAGLTHTRPPFGIDSVKVGNREVEVREEAAAHDAVRHAAAFQEGHRDGAAARAAGRAAVRPFRDAAARDRAHDAARPRRLHHRLAQRARRAAAAGRFGFDEYIDHLIKFLEVIGPGAHVLAVCQPCVAVLAAVAVMAQAGNPAQPRSMTLMAGPIDTRVNPTKVNELANARSIDWFERTLTASCRCAIPARSAASIRASCSSPPS